MSSPDLEIGYHKFGNTKFIGENVVQHTTFYSDSSLGTLRVRVKETWYREREIGSGSSGTVFLEKSGKEKHRAVKRIVKNKNSRRKIDYKRELMAMAVLSKHHNLFVQLFGWYENADYVYIAMEYISHGDLRNYLEKERFEDEAKVVTRQLLEGLVIIHQEGFAHRDLKPENIFVVSLTPVRVKIGDFGLAKLARNGTAFRTQGGTLEYIAPEVAGTDSNRETSEYTNAIDIWALGCIAHEMLTQAPPFRGWKKLSSYCSNSKFPRDAMLSKNISMDGIVFVESMLASSPERRVTAKEALDSEWLRLEDEGVAGLETGESLAGPALSGWPASPSGAVGASKESSPGILRVTNSSPLARTVPRPRSPREAHVNGQKEPQPSKPRLASPREIVSDLWSDDVIDMDLFPRTNSPDAIFGPKKRSTRLAVGLDTIAQSGAGEPTELPLSEPGEEAHLSGQPGGNKVRFRNRVAMIGDRPSNDSEAWEGLPLLDDKLERLNGVAHANGSVGRRAEESIVNRGQNPFRKPKPVPNITAEVRHVLKGVLLEIHASTDSSQKPMLKGDDAVQMLLDGRIRMDVKDSSGNTPLHIVASRLSKMTAEGDAPSLTVDALVASGSAIDRKNSQGKTPLLAAVDYGRKPVVEKLLELGANIEEPDGDGIRPLMMAVLRDNQPLVHLLLEKGAGTGIVQVKEKNVTPLHWAAETGSHSIVQDILGNGADINAQDGSKQTPLHRAIIKQHIAVAATLLRRRADIEAKDDTERTALHHAVAKPSVPLVKLLLDNGANPDVEDKWFDSPRREADRSNVHGMVDAFAQADVKRAQRVGKRNPLEFAPEYPGEEEYLYETDDD